MNGVNVPDDFEHGGAGIRTYKKRPPTDVVGPPQGGLVS